MQIQVCLFGLVESSLERRVLVWAELEGPSGIMNCFSIHLDHRSEDTRLKQFQQALEYMAQEGLDKSPHILMGDFNAIHHSHYPPTIWKSIISTRESNLWESPRNELIELIQSSGYQVSKLFSEVICE
jgi:exonuclease III